MVGQDPTGIDVSSEYGKAAQDVCEKFGGDREVVHIKLDELLCEALREHGEDELVEVFEAQGKWYA